MENLQVIVLKRDLSNVPESAKNEEYVTNIYAHGRVESFFEFDIAYIKNRDIFKTRKLSVTFVGNGKPTEIEDIAYCGIVPCEVEGYDRPCTAFIWWNEKYPNNPTKGLIVDNEDLDSINYAAGLLDKKPIMM